MSKQHGKPSSEIANGRPEHDPEFAEINLRDLRKRASWLDDDDWEALLELARRGPEWLKMAHLGRDFAIDRDVVRLASVAARDGAQVMVMPGPSDGRLDLTWPSESLSIPLPLNGWLWSPAATFNESTHLDRMLLSVDVGIAHERRVTQEGTRVRVDVGLPLGEDVETSLRDLRTLAEAQREAHQRIDELARDRGYADLVAQFNRAGLVPAEIPSPFRPVMRRLNDWLWSTQPADRVDRMSDYLNEIDWTMEKVGDHVTISQGGHGINSYAITWRMAYGPLAVHVQSAWGGIDQARGDDHVIAELFGQVRRVVQALPEAAELDPTERYRDYAVTCSTFRDGRVRCQQWSTAERRWVDTALPRDTSHHKAAWDAVVALVAGKKEGAHR